MVFSSNEDLDSGDQQTSLIPTVEEVVREEDLQGEDAGSEQQFGVFKDFDFLDVELEDAEVRGDLLYTRISHLYTHTPVLYMIICNSRSAVASFQIMSLMGDNKWFHSVCVIVGSCTQVHPSACAGLGMTFLPCCPLTVPTAYSS